jgi:site-specific recombinase XerD
MTSYSLFPDADSTAQMTQFLAQFDLWVTHRAENNRGNRLRAQRPLAEESIDVYRDMWRSFAEYCVPRGLTLADITASDLDLFLSIRGTGDSSRTPRITTRSDSLSSRYARRYLVLIDRVTRWLALQTQSPINAAALEMQKRPTFKYANAEDRDPAPQYLAAAQARRLIAYVTQLRVNSVSDAPLTWKEVRDRTAVAVMLGAGLAPGDVRTLRLSGVKTDGGRNANLPWKLALPGNGNIDARETPIAPWAGRQLALWMAVREQAAIAGDAVFPSTAGGRDWSHTRCFEACREVLTAAGLAADVHGLFQLRHTFALRQLSKGKQEHEVAAWLGLKNVKHMERYSRILLNPIDVV